MTKLHRIWCWGLLLIMIWASLNKPAVAASISESLQSAQSLVDQGRYLEALEILDAMNGQTSVDNPQQAIAVASLAATLRMRRGEYKQASDAFEMAAQVARQHGLSNAEVRALVNAADANIRQQDMTQAGRLLVTAGMRAATVGDANEQALLYTAIGRRYARLASLQKDKPRSSSIAAASKYLEEGAVIASALDNKHLEALAASYLADLSERAEQFSDAVTRARRALFLAQQAAAPDLQFRMQWLLGRLARAQKKFAQARERFDTALALAQDFRAELRRANPDEPSEASANAFFLEYADLLLTQAPGEARASDAILTRALDTVELIKATELEDYFQDDCVAAWQAKSTGVQTIAEHTAVLYPMVFQDRLELLLALHGGIQRVSVAVDKSRLTTQVRELRGLLEKRTTRQYLPAAQAVYRLMFAPLEEVLRKHAIETVVVVPDSIIRVIPLAALHDGTRFLVERFAIAVTPGMTLTDPQPFSARTPKILISGLTESVQGFPALPFVTQELAGVSKLIEGKTLKDQDYRLENLQSELAQRPYSVIHLASHAQFGRDASDTFLLTFNDRIGINRLEQVISTRKFADEPIELLAMSACQTAAGDERAALGLAGVAVKAGARSALASLWFINDPASSQLAIEFYRNLQAGQSKAQALQASQRLMLADRRYRHPAYWAAFILIGNWL